MKRTRLPNAVVRVWDKDKTCVVSAFKCCNISEPLLLPWCISASNGSWADTNKALGDLNSNLKFKPRVWACVCVYVCVCVLCVHGGVCEGMYTWVGGGGGGVGVVCACRCVCVGMTEVGCTESWTSDAQPLYLLYFVLCTCTWSQVDKIEDQQLKRMYIVG